jgi:hypothetical protein
VIDIGVILGLSEPCARSALDEKKPFDYDAPVEGLQHAGLATRCG